MIDYLLFMQMLSEKRLQHINQRCNKISLLQRIVLDGSGRCPLASLYFLYPKQKIQIKNFVEQNSLFFLLSISQIYENTLIFQSIFFLWLSRLKHQKKWEFRLSPKYHNFSIYFYSPLSIYIPFIIEGCMETHQACASALDGIFGEDEKKKIHSLTKLRDISKILGPEKIKNEFIPLLSQLLDEEPKILSLLLTQLKDFDIYIGGLGTSNALIPFLIKCCCLDQKQIAEQAVQIILQISSNNINLYQDSVDQLLRNNMNSSIESGLLLLNQAIRKLPDFEPHFISIYHTYLIHQNPSYRIIAAKHFGQFAHNVKDKQKLFEIFQEIYNDSEDLPKILTIQPLLALYEYDKTRVISKIRFLVTQNSWRINLKLAEFSQLFKAKLSEDHFKEILIPTYLQMMVSEDTELKKFGIATLRIVSSVVISEKNEEGLWGVLQHIVKDPNNHIQLSKEIVKIFPFFCSETIKTKLVPLALQLIDKNKIQISEGIIQEFQQISKYLTPDEIESSILRPFHKQIEQAEWRLKVRILQMIKKIIVKGNLRESCIIELIFDELRGRIEATRKKSVQVISQLLQNNDSTWSKLTIMPQIRLLSIHQNYLIRQQALNIIDRTLPKINHQIRQQLLAILKKSLSDKIPNIRLIALRVINHNRSLLDEAFLEHLRKLEDDEDPQVQSQSKIILIS